MSTAQRLLMEGASDAVGFVGGALAGYGVGLLLGMDIFSEGYGAASIAGIALVGIGGGLGLHLARRWRAARSARKE
ncbi:MULTISPECIES: hypothetical protein [Diaphorobacter]|uniref:Uncharacterized protein n=1 Tax=Diaphorobacter nitroreducens TaxID=164759 RepID=A0AAX1WT39_9BURK|nr:MULTISPECIES: hypothetical protein [Diaphorobacter]KLR58740.1 hypothetical protein OX89_04540 [Diaphorobacter sp. J5-51]ROR41707.1 hypothetical protein EDC60_2356 [Diaphorobacter nitroreducens]UOB06416.1 hypothetical protein MRB47_04700 [Diaphorobacter sp. LI3]WKK88362.1 hypothetical protein QY917_10925 [Diaphorobacter sp. C33]